MLTMSNDEVPVEFIPPTIRLRPFPGPGMSWIQKRATCPSVLGEATLDQGAAIASRSPPGLSRSTATAIEDKREKG